MIKSKIQIKLNHNGSVLLFLLISVSLFGLMAGIAGTSWQSIIQQGKETDLLWKGNKIRQAIGSYYEASNSEYPTKFEYLIKDQRFLQVKRHLRKIYLDPMTGQEWETIKNKNGGIIGVRSKSNKVPFKKNGFIKLNKTFIDQDSYKDWLFVYSPSRGS